MELIIVIVIIGILATLGFTHYGTYKESTLNKEAQANLRLIVAAERIYRMEIGSYFPCSDNDCINTNLRLYLSNLSDPNRKWDYRATDGGTSTCAQATRFNGPNTRTFKMSSDDNDPVADGICP